MQLICCSSTKYKALDDLYSVIKNYFLDLYKEMVGMVSELTNIKKQVGLAEFLLDKAAKCYAWYKNEINGATSDNYMSSQKYYKMAKEKAEDAEKK